MVDGNARRDLQIGCTPCADLLSFLREDLSFQGSKAKGGETVIRSGYFRRETRLLFVACFLLRSSASCRRVQRRVSILKRARDPRTWTE